MKHFKHNKLFLGISAGVLAGTLGAGALAQSPYTKPDEALITISGTVDKIYNDSFTLDYDNEDGDGIITVEMDEMGYDPLDDVGYPQVDRNDIVSVRGHIDYDLFENHSFEAEGITTVLNTGR